MNKKMMKTMTKKSKSRMKTMTKKIKPMSKTNRLYRNLKIVKLNNQLIIKLFPWIW